MASSFHNGDEGVEGAGDIPGAGVPFATSLMHDDSGITSGVMCLFGDIINPSSEIHARMVLHLDRRPTQIGNPNVSSIQRCSGRHSFGLDAVNVEMIGDGTLSSRSFRLIPVRHRTPSEISQTHAMTAVIKPITATKAIQSDFIVDS
jgi:hypothetical protein